MQHDTGTSSDISRPPYSAETGSSGMDQGPRANRTSSPVDTIMSAASRAGSVVFEEAQQRPMAVGILISALVGWFAGLRVARMRAARRRSDYEKIMDALAGAAAVVVESIPRPPSIPMDAIRERGAEAVGAATTLGSSMIERVPSVTERIPAMVEKVPELTSRRQRMSMAKRVRGAAGLVPITMALLRNPLVRDMLIRQLSRRRRRR